MFGRKAMTLVLAAAGAAALAGLAGCNGPTSTVAWENDGIPRHVPYSKHMDWRYKLVYYPACDVYFEPFTQVWYWYDNGLWYEADQLPSHIAINDATPRVVRLETRKPYMNHDVTVAWANEGHSCKPGATDIAKCGAFVQVDPWFEQYNAYQSWTGGANDGQAGFNGEWTAQFDGGFYTPTVPGMPSESTSSFWMQSFPFMQLMPQQHETGEMHTLVDSSQGNNDD